MATKKSAKKGSKPLSVTKKRIARSAPAMGSKLDAWTSMFAEDVRRESLRGVIDISDRKWGEIYAIDYQLSATTTALGFNSISEILANLKKYSEDARDVFAELKEIVQNFSNVSDKIIEIVTDVENTKKDNPEAQLLILRYLIKGKCTDRFGEEIKRPEGEFKNEYFNIGIDMGKIVLQRTLDKKLGLLWFADSDTHLDDQKKAHKFWEAEATKLSNPLIGAAVSAGLSAIPKLQDDAKKAASMVIGVSFSKSVEGVISKSIEKNPTKWIESMKKIEG